MPNKCSPQTLFVFRADCQSVCGLSESMNIFPTNLITFRIRTELFYPGKDRDRWCTDGPSQIWFSKTFFSLYPWVISPPASCFLAEMWSPFGHIGCAVHLSLQGGIERPPSKVVAGQDRREKEGWVISWGGALRPGNQVRPDKESCDCLDHREDEYRLSTLAEKCGHWFPSSFWLTSQLVSMVTRDN